MERVGNPIYNVEITRSLRVRLDLSFDKKKKLIYWKNKNINDRNWPVQFNTYFYAIRKS